MLANNDERAHLTPIQLELLHFLKLFIDEYGYPPSIREISKALTLRSNSTAHYHLHQLSEKGYVRVDPYKQRAIVILPEAETS